MSRARKRGAAVSALRRTRVHDAVPMRMQGEARAAQIGAVAEGVAGFGAVGKRSPVRAVIAARLASARVLPASPVPARGGSRDALCYRARLHPFNIAMLVGIIVNYTSGGCAGGSRLLPRPAAHRTGEQDGDDANVRVAAGV